MRVRGAFHVYPVLHLIGSLPKIFNEFALKGTEPKERILEILQQYTIRLLFVNSCLNPLIYYCKLRHIRRTIRMTLRNSFVNDTVVGAAVEIESTKK